MNAFFIQFTQQNVLINTNHKELEIVYNNYRPQVTIFVAYDVCKRNNGAYFS